MTAGDVFYLAGITDGNTGQRRVDVCEWYDSEQEARDRLGIVMSLSALAYGDALTDSASWYLQHAAPQPHSALERTDYFYGYRLDDAMGDGKVDLSHFRFAPVSSELLVRPLNVQSGELLF